MARTLLKYSVNSGDPGDIFVRVGAAPDAIVADQAKSDGPINGPINKRVLQFVREHAGCGCLFLVVFLIGILVALLNK